MIKFNEKYTINKGQESITFSQGKGDSIIGQYGSGTLTGIIDGDVLKATYHNQKNNSAGLIEITFHEKGFNAKWKQGLEPGPMRGNWKGLIGENNEPATNKNDNTNTEGIQPTKFDELGNSEQVFFLQINCPESFYEFEEKIQSTARFFKEQINENAIGFLFEEVTDEDSIALKTDNFSLLADNFSEKIEAIFNTNKHFFDDGDGTFFMAFLIPIDRYLSPIINSLYGTLEDLWENVFRELSTIIQSRIQIFSYHEEFSDIIKQKYYLGEFGSGMINSKLEDFIDDSESDHLKSEQPTESFPADDFFELFIYTK
jgi:hypothetical protein